jgi:hypothetical protein
VGGGGGGKRGTKGGGNQKWRGLETNARHYDVCANFLHSYSAVEEYTHMHAWLGGMHPGMLLHACK